MGFRCVRWFFTVLCVVTVQLPLRRTKKIQAFHRWFYEKPLKRDTVMLTYYYHCASKEQIQGFEREAK